jgi:hypothetical protein
MNILWHTALSVLDVGSNLVYHILGRHLNENDIKQIELLFKYSSVNSLTSLLGLIWSLDGLGLTSERTQIESHVNSILNSNPNFNKLVELIQSERCKDDSHLREICELFNKKVPRGKDLLLVTNKANGYNLLQFSLVNLNLNKIVLIQRV